MLINIDLGDENIHNLKLDENVVYNFLKIKYTKTKKKDTTTKISGQLKFVYLPTKVLNELFNISTFKQCGILDRLQEMGLIEIKFSQQRARYYRIIDNSIERKKEKILKQIKNMNNRDVEALYDVYQKIIGKNSD